MSEITLVTLQCLRDVQLALTGETPLENIAHRLHSILYYLEVGQENEEVPWLQIAVEVLNRVIQIIVSNIDSSIQSAVGKKIKLPMRNVEVLISMKFKLKDIAVIYGVSKITLARRLREEGISVRLSYSDITDEELQGKVAQMLHRFPNTGYKRMKGFLLNDGVKVTDQRVLETMRLVDPVGVLHRRLTNRAIIRRQYNVRYFNQLWHLDTNLKLIRWNIVIRACIDGKSRLVVFLNCNSDNTAQSNLNSFVKATQLYGIPSRTRSDKGRENILVAQFMIAQRGVGRKSHICGRSVHNQRIERYWRDVYYGYASDLVNIFTMLEFHGLLDIDNKKHLLILHKVFIPRINTSLEQFRNAWNHHPLSSESNYTPTQLMILNLPPPGMDLLLDEVEFGDYLFACNYIQDTGQLEISGEDDIRQPRPLEGLLNNIEEARLAQIDFDRESGNLGCDLYLEAINCLD